MAITILDENDRSGIYQIRNLLNCKVYIGSAKCFRIRWKEHKRKLCQGNHHSRYLQASWNKYGAGAFAFEILELCDVGDLLRREQFWFEFRKPEYNICLIAGNTSGRKHSDETKRKIGNRALGRKYPPRSKEYRQKLSLRSKGKPKPAHVINALQSGRAKRVYTEDQREQIAKSLRDAYADGRRSKVKSDDHRYKIGRAFSKLSDEEVRQIRILRADGISCREVAVRFGSNAGTVSEICTGKRYRWVQ